MKWTDEDVERWVRILGKHTRISDAMQEIGLSSDIVEGVFRRRGLPAPGQHLGSSRTTFVVYGSELAPEIPPPPPLPTIPSQREPLNTATETPPNHRDERIQRLVFLCQRRPRSLEDLCNDLKEPPRVVRKLVEKAKNAGFHFKITDDQLGWDLPIDEPSAEQSATVYPATSGRYIVAVIGDVHFGSLYCLRPQLRDFCKRAYEKGVRMFLQVGDLLDGCYRHGRYELSHHGWDDQAQDAFENLPSFKDASWYFIDGNHDETFSKEIGMLSGQRLVDYFRANGRHDLNFLGARGGNMRLHHPNTHHTVKVELWHPRKGSGYALTYQLQNHIRDYSVGSKPDILCAGHWHHFSYLEQRGVHAMSCGTFQGGGSSFSKSLGGAVSIGAQIVGYELTEHGTLRHVSVERTSYYEQESDRSELITQSGQFDPGFTGTEHTRATEREQEEYGKRGASEWQ